MSKYQFRESDIYLSGTNIPKNRLGIEDANLLQEIEESLLQQAYQVFIAELQPAVRFDESYFKSLHYRTFITLYDWAGEYRLADMSKGGSLFCLARHLDSASRHIFQQLERENFLKNSSDWLPQQFSERLAFYQSELIALHPFYELNGRITRLFFDLIAISKKPELTISRELALLREQDLVNEDLILKDSYILDFLDLNDSYLEKDLKDAFLRELGSGFSFVARQYRIQIDNDDFYIDLLFYKRKLKRLVAIDLKAGSFKAEYKGQMELYLRWLAKYEHEADENSPLGIILCAGKKTRANRIAGIGWKRYSHRRIPDSTAAQSRA